MAGTENDVLAEKSYPAWQVNRGLSHFVDTIEHANTMNGNYNLDNKLQYLYLMHSVRSKKRFGKWVKKNKDSDMSIIREYFNCNDTRAGEILSLITPEIMEQIKKTIALRN